MQVVRSTFVRSGNNRMDMGIQNGCQLKWPDPVAIVSHEHVVLKINAVE